MSGMVACKTKDKRGPSAGKRAATSGNCPHCRHHPSCPLAQLRQRECLGRIIRRHPSRVALPSSRIRSCGSSWRRAAKCGVQKLLLGAQRSIPYMQQNLVGHCFLKSQPTHGQLYKHTVIVGRRDGQLDMADVAVRTVLNMKNSRGR